MKLTALDVLIVTFLSQQPKYNLDKPLTVELSRTVFETHSQFVKHSPLFNVHYKGQFVSISVGMPRESLSEQQNPMALTFAKKCSYWRSRYKQDCLLPFEESGFGALRLAENAELFSGLLFNQGHIKWDLQADKCYIGTKQQPGSGLQWAWDWFAVSWIAHRECGLIWADFDPHLDSIHAPHIVGLNFRAEGTALARISKGEHSLCCELLKQINAVTDCDPLLLVSGSKRITLKKYPNIPLKLSDYERRLVWLCATNPDDRIPITLAFEFVTGRKTPKKNYTPAGDNTASAMERRQKALENVRNNYWKEVQRVAKNQLKELPYISVTKQGVQMHSRTL